MPPCSCNSYAIYIRNAEPDAYISKYNINMNIFIYIYSNSYSTHRHSNRIRICISIVAVFSILILLTYTLLIATNVLAQGALVQAHTHTRLELTPP